MKLALMRISLLSLLAVFFNSGIAFADSYKILDFVAEGKTLGVYAEVDVKGVKKTVRVPIAGGDYSKAYVTQSLENYVNTAKLSDVMEITDVSADKTRREAQAAIYDADRVKKEADVKTAETALVGEIGKTVDVAKVG